MSLNADLDTEQLISEVHARPAIWDSESPDYVNKHLKNRCWDEVCFATYPGFEDENDEQKSEISKLMRRRWRSLRDCYTRELNATKARKSTASRRKNKKKTYIYFDQLHFIRPSVEKRTYRYEVEDAQDKDHSNHDSEEPCDEEELLSDLPMNPDCKIDDSYCLEDYDEKYQPQTLLMENPIKRNADSGEFQDCQSEAKQKRFSPDLSDVPHSTNNPNDDQDRMFMLSLLDDFKKVHETHRLDLKCDIITAIRKWQKMSPK